MSPFICGYEMLWLMLAMDMWNQNLRSNIQLASIGNGKMMTMCFLLCLYIWSFVSSELQTQSISQLGCIMIRSFNETTNMVSGFKMLSRPQVSDFQDLHGLFAPMEFPSVFFLNIWHTPGKNHMEPQYSADFVKGKHHHLNQTHHFTSFRFQAVKIFGGVAVFRSCQETPSQQLA